MASLNSISVKSGFSRRSRRTGSTSDLASISVREAGSGHYGKSSKHLSSKIRIATWNVGTLKKRSNEVVETLSRRHIDICGFQEHRWSGSLLPYQTRLLTGKNLSYKLYWCCSQERYGGAGILLSEQWIDKVFEVKLVFDRVVLKLIIGEAVFSFFSILLLNLVYPRQSKKYSMIIYKLLFQRYLSLNHSSL